MTDTELDVLESAAKAVFEKFNELWEIQHGGIMSECIAAANPAIVLELIAELRQARAELDWLVKNTHINNCPDCRNMESCLKYSDCEACWIQAAKEATCRK